MNIDKHRAGSVERRSSLLPVLLAAAVLCLSVAPVMAHPGNGNGWGAGGSKGGGSKGAPGPIAGAGLPFLIGAAAVGAYKRIQRRKDTELKNQGQNQG